MSSSRPQASSSVSRSRPHVSSTMRPRPPSVVLLQSTTTRQRSNSKGGDVGPASALCSSVTASALDDDDDGDGDNAVDVRAASTSTSSSSSSSKPRTRGTLRRHDTDQAALVIKSGSDADAELPASASSAHHSGGYKKKSSSRKSVRVEQPEVDAKALHLAIELAERDELPPLPPLDGASEHALGLTRDNLGSLVVPIKPLGCGSYGVVMLVRHVPSGRLLAMKKMSKRRIIDYRHTEHILSEKALLQRVRHPFVVELVDTLNDDHYLYMFFEFCAGGELFSRLRLGAVNEAAAAFYVGQVALALRYLHKRSIVYRDIKPENVVVDAHGHVRLVDFGFAKRVAARSWSICGTIEYLAPEVVAGRGGGFAADWWALGCMLFEMIAGRSPFRMPKRAAPVDDETKAADRKALFRDIREGALDFPPAMSDACRHLCAGLLRVEPEERFAFRQLKRHDFFASVDWKQLELKQVTPPWQPKLDGPEDLRYFSVPRDDLLRFLKTQPGPPKDQDPFVDF